MTKAASRSGGPGQAGTAEFVPLLNGAEAPAAVHQRERLFSEGWNEVHGRVKVRFSRAFVLRTSTDNESDYSERVEFCDSGTGEGLRWRGKS